jgi:methylase of polypeptide subunit release factors
VLDRTNSFGKPGEQERLQGEDARVLQETSRLNEGRKGHFTKVGSFDIFVDEDKYGPKVSRALDNGGYEGRERALVSKFVQSTDKVIEVGTAVGVVSMTAASIVGPKNVLTFDPNPDIVADARANFIHNGLADINSKVAILACKKKFEEGGTVEFHISK